MASAGQTHLYFPLPRYFRGRVGEGGRIAEFEEKPPP